MSCLHPATTVMTVTLALSGVCHGAERLEEVLVTSTFETRTIDVSDALVISPDTAHLLKKAPGANVNGNGPLTGIPQYRGMYGPRIATSMDGKQLAPAGPNWMDPPLSYAAAGQLESLELYRGIAPVSVAQEAIGGVVEVHTDRGAYGDTDRWQFRGQLGGNIQSINHGSHFNAALYGADQRQRFKAAVMTESGGNAEFPGGSITPSEYRRQRYDLGYGIRQGNHSIQFDYGYNDTGNTGTAALPMDIDTIKGKLYSMDYTYTPQQSLSIDLSLYGSHLDHTMTNFHLRRPPSVDRWRQNTADANNSGFKLKATLIDEYGSWGAGLDGFSEKHNSDIDNPNNPMFYVTNFNEAEREILGVYIERTQEWNTWSGQLGLRYNRVTTNAGAVDASSATQMPPTQWLRDSFNNAKRGQVDHNVDLAAHLSYRASATTRWYAGFAQKHRSPSYQERYLWLPLEATGGLADGYTYTGNIGLKPERSTQVELGFDFGGATVNFSPRLFYNRVDNYIQGTPSDVIPAVMVVRMMNAANGTDNPDPLQFNNVDAALYGFDMDWRWQVMEKLTLDGIVNYVRGEREDIHDSLYRIAPPNASVQLSYTGPDWATGIEAVIYSRQHHVSSTNNEKTSSGYALLNLSANLQLTGNLRLAAGVNNVFNKRYREHLGGYNRAENPDIPVGQRLPGQGTNVFVKAQWSF